MDCAIIFDCEFLAKEGVQRRFWCGPFDPDPQVVQIGAVKLGLSGDYAILGTYRSYIKPVGRDGRPAPIDPFMTQLTGITPDQIDELGQPLDGALAQLDAFADGASFWSWGKDELNMLAISCYVTGITPPLPISRFDNACKLMISAGMPYADVQTTPSNGLLRYFGLPTDDLRDHDALDDAMQVAKSLQFQLRSGALTSAAFGNGAN